MPVKTTTMIPSIRSTKSLHQAHSPTYLPDRSHHPRMMAMAIAATMAMIPRKKLLPRRGFAFGKSLLVVHSDDPRDTVGSSPRVRQIFQG